MVRKWILLEKELVDSQSILSQKKIMSYVIMFGMIFLHMNLAIIIQLKKVKKCCNELLICVPTKAILLWIFSEVQAQVWL